MEVLSRIPVVADIFQCTCCGFCCHGETTVSLNEADQKRMATLMALPREEVLHRFWPLHPSILTDEANFLTITSSCPGLKKELGYESFCRIFKTLIANGTLMAKDFCRRRSE